MAAPALSIIVTSTTTAEDRERLLRDLQPQTVREDVDVYLCDTTGVAPEELPPRYHWRAFPPGTGLPALLGAALGEAQGAVLALTDTASRLAPDWVGAILKAHEAPHPLIGGAVEPGPDQTPTDWVAYFCDYAQFMRPLPAGPADEVPGNNVSFKRELLDRHRAYVAPAFWKTYWCRSLQAEGLILHQDPSIVTYNVKSYTWRAFLKRRFHHGRCFGGMRMPEASRPRRLAFALGTTVLPLLSLQRIARRLHRKSRMRARFALLLPAVGLAVLAWSAGEGIGYLRGPGLSCRHV